jgi:hypothetical protein
VRPAIPSWFPRVTGSRFRTAWTRENPCLHHRWHRRVFLFRTGSRRSSITCCRPESLHWESDPPASWPRPHGIHAMPKCRLLRVIHRCAAFKGCGQGHASLCFGRFQRSRAGPGTMQRCIACAQTVIGDGRAAELRDRSVDGTDLKKTCCPSGLYARPTW